MESPINMPAGISACFATVELDISACTTLEGGGSIEQCTIELVATEVRLIGTRGGRVAHVGVPAIRDHAMCPSFASSSCTSHSNNSYIQTPLAFNTLMWGSLRLAQLSL